MDQPGDAKHEFFSFSPKTMCTQTPHTYTTHIHIHISQIHTNRQFANSCRELEMITSSTLRFTNDLVCRMCALHMFICLLALRGEYRNHAVCTEQLSDPSEVFGTRFQMRSCKCRESSLNSLNCAFYCIFEMRSTMEC